MKNFNRVLIIFLTFISLSSCSSIKNENVNVNVKDQHIYVQDIEKYGNLVLSISGTDFLNNGYDFGDIINVIIDEKEYDMPVCSNYTDVVQGELLCRVWIDEELNENRVLVCINMGDFATEMKIAKKEKTDEVLGYRWVYNVKEPCDVYISMKEKGGYKEKILINSIMSERSNNRNDYDDLSDDEFANFRMIKTNNIKEGVLYRSSSPVNPKYGRNDYADAAAKKVGINTFINLADDLNEIQSYKGFNDTYYSGKKIITLNLAVDINGNEYKEGVAKTIRIINENEGPYLIHCDEGKDRAGFMIAILEAMMGATAEEVVNDYMITYYNYYHIKLGDIVYENIKKMNIEKSLSVAFGVDNIYNADLYKECEKYLLSIGLSIGEIDLARNKLS